MRSIAATFIGLALAATLALSGSALAQENIWRIAKITGQAWLGGDGVATAALSQDAVLKPGDSIRTGRNGRVLLMRGAETMMISANSAISLPAAGRAGMTTVIQQAGTILLDVEKRNVQHFEVETPYLAAVVKGTRFTVTVADGRAQVNVARGQVQVADFRSGQFALVLPGQIARVAQRGVGLQLSGPGALSAIQQGPAQAPRIAPLPVPQQGFTAPGVAPMAPAPVAPAQAAPAQATRAQPVVQEARAPREGGIVRGRNGALRIAAPMGEVKLDINKVTKGLARNETHGPVGHGRKNTIWSEGGTVSAQTEASESAGAGRGLGEGSSGAGTVAASSLGNVAGNRLSAVLRIESGADLDSAAMDGAKIKGKGKGNSLGRGDAQGGGRDKGSAAARAEILLGQLQDNGKGKGKALGVSKNLGALVDDNGKGKDKGDKGNGKR